MNRRDFLKGLVATAAGVLVPASVAAEPERRIWALDRTMVEPEPLMLLRGQTYSVYVVSVDEMLAPIAIVPYEVKRQGDGLFDHTWSFDLATARAIR